MSPVQPDIWALRSVVTFVAITILSGCLSCIFAGSIASLEPLHSSDVLTEKSSAYGNIAYSKSKAMGEQLLSRNSDRVPVVIL